MAQNLRKREAGQLPLAGQIEAWVRLQILTGAVEAGSRLPSAEALADKFKVNANTVREGFARLADQDLVEVKHGRGVFVIPSVPTDRARRTRALLSETIARGTELGLDANALASMLWAYDAGVSVGRRFWLVDVRHPYLASFVEALQAGFDAPVKFVAFGELDDASGVMPARNDVVFTRFRFVNEVRRRFADLGAQVFPLRVKPDTRGMIQLASYRPEARLRSVCVEEGFARSMGRTVARQGIGLVQSYAVVGEASSVDDIYRDCDVVITSCLGHDRLHRLTGGKFPRPTITLKFEIEADSIEVIKSLIEDDKAAPDPAAATT